MQGDATIEQCAALISGTAASSLGSLWIRAYLQRAKDAPVVAIDREHDPEILNFRSVRTVPFDLNPLNQSSGFVQFVEQLHAALGTAHEALGFDGLSTFLSGAGAYDSGPLVDSTIEARRRLLGVNVCGNLELLVAALALNKRLGFDSSGQLSFLEIGSLRGLQVSPGRAAYAASKAFAGSVSGLETGLARAIRESEDQLPCGRQTMRNLLLDPKALGSLRDLS